MSTGSFRRAPAAIRESAEANEGIGRLCNRPGARRLPVNEVHGRQRRAAHLQIEDVRARVVSGDVERSA